MDVNKLMGFSEDLIKSLSDPKDINSLSLYIHKSKSHFQHSLFELNSDQNLIKEYQEKIVLSKKKAEEAKSEAAASALDFLQKELEEEFHKERVLKQELSTVITNEISDLEHQRDSVEERRKIVKKLKQDELKAEMKLAMYASVTKVIPNLDEDSKISGCIVDKEKEVLEHFEYDLSEGTSFDMCNSIWEKINTQ